MMNQLPVKAIVLLLVIVGFNILFGIDGVALLDPDEPVYAETAKEMIRFNEYLSPRIYNEYWYDKPPIFYWLLVGSLKLFGGFSELAARLPASLMAIGAVLMTTVSAARQFSARAGFWSGLVMGTTVMIMYMGKASVTDTTLLFFMTGALLCFMHEKYWLMYLFCGFAVMTKGPIGVVFPGAIVFLYLLVTRDLGRMLRMHVIPGLILVAAVGMPWYVFMYQNHGMDFIYEFIGFHNISRFSAPLHPNRVHWWFYLPVIILGLFPWTGVLLKSMKDAVTKSVGRESTRLLFLQIWWIFVFIFFSIAKTKQVSYMLVLLPALSMIIGWNIERMTCENGKCQTGWVIGTFVMYLLMGVGWIVGGRQMPELAMGGMILGVATLVLGALNLLALKKYCNVESAAWLHVVTGLVTMVMAFGVLMPQIQDRFSVKTIAATYMAAEKDAWRVLYVDRFLRPGFMLYTDIPGIEADVNSEKSLDAVKQDPRQKYIVMREHMYEKMKEKMGGENWELLENKSGICIYRSR